MSRRRIIAAIGLASIFMTERAVVQTPPRSLDLRLERLLRNGSRAIFCAGGSAVTHMPPLRLPLRMTIDPLDADRYSMSDAFTYTVRLRNVADAPVTVPWSERLHVPCGGRDRLQPVDWTFSPAIRAMVKQRGAAVLRAHARLHAHERQGRSHDEIVSENEIAISLSAP